jgi:hypothetical protein
MITSVLLRTSSGEEFNISIFCKRGKVIRGNEKFVGQEVRLKP